MANATDGTQLNPGSSGDVIATEDMPVGAPRGDSALPLTDYKLPRSKIATGAYDQDLGDVGPTNQFHVRMMEERRLMEEETLSQHALVDAAHVRRSGERLNLLDRHGNTSRGSTR